MLNVQVVLSETCGTPSHCKLSILARVSGQELSGCELSVDPVIEDKELDFMVK